MVRLSTIALAFAIVVPGVASAQNQVVGQWQCEHTQRGRATTYTWTYKYQLVIRPDGTFQAQGTDLQLSRGWTVPFYAQGRWTRSSEGIMLNGSEMEQGGPTGKPFFAAFSVFTPRAMSFRTVNQTPYGPAPAAWYCQR